MTVAQMLELMRPRIADADPARYEYSDAELIGYLNDAIRYVSDYIVRSGNPVFLANEGVLAEGDSVPEDIIAWAGQYPLNIRGGTVHPDYPVTARWFAYPSILTSLSSAMPLSGDYSKILQVAVILARRRNDFDQTQDMSIPVMVQGLFGGKSE